MPQLELSYRKANANYRYERYHLDSIKLCQFCIVSCFSRQQLVCFHSFGIFGSKSFHELLIIFSPLISLKWTRKLQKKQIWQPCIKKEWPNTLARANHHQQRRRRRSCRRKHESKTFRLARACSRVDESTYFSLHTTSCVRACLRSQPSKPTFVHCSLIYDSILEKKQTKKKKIFFFVHFYSFFL